MTDTATEILDSTVRVDPAGAGPEGWAVVLVHGGQHDASCWRLLQPRLSVPSVAVNLPGRPGGPAPRDDTLSTLVDYVVDVVEAVAEPNVLLVGHSMAGLVLPNASEASDKVRHAAYVSALLPDGVGVSLTDSLQRMAWSSAFRAYANRQPEIRLLGNRGVRRLWTAPLLSLDGVPQDVRRDFVDRLRPETNWRVDVRPPAELRTPKTWVFFLGDRALPPKQAMKMVARLPGPFALRAVPGGHCAMVTHPQELAATLDDIVLSSAARSAG